MADHDPTDERGKDASSESDEERRRREERERTFRRLGDSLISSIWGDASAGIKRGQGVVAGVAQDTKEELVRMISQEVRGFLDKMDAADLVQEIVSGLVIEMKTEIRFKRDESGRVEPDIRTTDTKVGSESAPAREPTPEPAPASTPAPAPASKPKRSPGKLNELLNNKLNGKRTKARDDDEAG